MNANLPAITNRKNQRPDGRSGVVLLLVLLCLVVVSILGATAYTLGRIEVSSTSDFNDIEQSFQNADAGARYVLAKLKSDVAGGSVSLSGTTVSVYYAAPSGLDFDPVTSLSRLADGKAYKFTVVGRANSSRATIEMAVRSGTSGYGDFFSEGLMTLSGGSSATGDVSCNVGITLSSSSHVEGDASPGPGYTVDATKVSGDTTPLSETIDLPAVDAGDLADAKANNMAPSITPSGYYDASKGEFSCGGGSVATFPAGTYYFTRFTVSGGGKIIISGATEIYCTGSFTISGGSLDNTTLDPDNLKIFTTGTDKVTYSGTSAGYAQVYAPYASEVVISGGGTFNGTIASGGKLTVSGGSDLQAAGTGAGPGEVEMEWWRQVL